MPRGPRVDAPGAVQHVIVRGIDRNDIFLDDADRRDLLDRLSRILPESGCTCFAWALMSNHVHLVVRTGLVPIGTVMSRIGTGYALYFNRRWDRVGHLVENRFKSRLVHDDSDLLNLIRYVHLNPLRAGIVRSLEELSSHLWSGHAALAGSCPAQPFHDWRQVLGLFDEQLTIARERLALFMCSATDVDPYKADNPVNERLRNLIDQVCSAHGVDSDELRAGVRRRRVSSARREIARRAVEELGLSHRRIGPALGVSGPAVSQLVSRRQLSS